MATPVEIGIFRIAHTVVDRAAVELWLRFIDVENFEMPEDGAVSNPALLIALAGKRCYRSFEVDVAQNKNVTKIRKDYGEYLDNVLASGHGSVCEHAVYTFAIENVSRVFTAEMNRHRAGWAISEGSMRFIRFNDINFWMPTSLLEQDTDDSDLAERKRASREIFIKAFTQDEKNYQELEAIWDMDAANHNFSYKKKITSMMRRTVGMGVATGGVWTGNIRALRHVLTMRCAPVAEEEILHVFSRIAVDIKKTEPLLFGDFYQDAEGFWRPKYMKV